MLRKICLVLAMLFMASISEVAFADVAPLPGENPERHRREIATSVELKVQNIDAKKNRIEVLISPRKGEDVESCVCKILQSNGDEVKNYSGKFDKERKISFKFKYAGLAEDYPRNLLFEIRTSSDKVQTRYGTKTTQNPTEKISRFTMRFMRDRDGNLVARVSSRFSRGSVRVDS